MPLPWPASDVILATLCHVQLVQEGGPFRKTPESQSPAWTTAARVDVSDFRPTCNEMNTTAPRSWKLPQASTSCLPLNGQHEGLIPAQEEAPKKFALRDHYPTEKLSEYLLLFCRAAPRY